MKKNLIINKIMAFFAISSIMCASVYANTPRQNDFTKYMADNCAKILGGQSGVSVSSVLEIGNNGKLNTNPNQIREYCLQNFNTNNYTETTMNGRFNTIVETTTNKKNCLPKNQVIGKCNYAIPYSSNGSIVTALNKYTDFKGSADFKCVNGVFQSVNTASISCEKKIEYCEDNKIANWNTESNLTISDRESYGCSKAIGKLQEGEIKNLVFSGKDFSGSAKVSCKNGKLTPIAGKSICEKNICPLSAKVFWKSSEAGSTNAVTCSGTIKQSSVENSGYAEYSITDSRTFSYDTVNSKYFSPNLIYGYAKYSCVSGKWILENNSTCKQLKIKDLDFTCKEYYQDSIVDGDIKKTPYFKCCKAGNICK